MTRLSCLLFTLVISHAQTSERPHIVFIVADDLGWNDVGFHGSNQIPTPNIDALAYSGLILNNYYVTPICTPSRAALMTGKYPIHTGMQHGVLYAGEARGVPLSEKFLPEYLRDLGYRNHIVGKWHLGHFKKEYTPLHRGFESHTGFWSGRIDYFDHTSQEFGMWGLDMRKGMDSAWDLHGKYNTELFTTEAVKVIKSHNASEPLFLYLAHSAVHSGNPYNPLPAPDYVVEKFAYIENRNRSRFAAMLSMLDDSVGNVVKALSVKNMLSNSIIVFTTDNGGPAAGFNFNAASNWPLKGVKNTLWEGGVRGAALLWSPLIEKNKRVAKQLMHITDWLPTLYSAAGGDSKAIPNGLDAVDQWEALSKDQLSNRTEVLHNIDDIHRTAALMAGQWKVTKGTTYNADYDFWFGPSGRAGNYNLTNIIESNSGKSINAWKKNELNAETIYRMRDDAAVTCDNTAKPVDCLPFSYPCLFNIALDPCERKNLAHSKDHRSILSELLAKLDKYNATAVPASTNKIDPRSNPMYWNYTWTNFGDYPVPFVTRL